MRGKLRFAGRYMSMSGITPAHAGKTKYQSAFQPRNGDHPRACGETPNRKRVTNQNGGSPPRMRGKPCDNLRDFLEWGITPAHAGKTGDAVAQQVLQGDHPRACGENCGTLWI